MQGFEDNYENEIFSINLVTVFDAILTSRQVYKSYFCQNSRSTEIIRH